MMNEEDKLYENINTDILRAWARDSNDLANIHVAQGKHHIDLAAYYDGRCKKLIKVLEARLKELDDSKNV